MANPIKKFKKVKVSKNRKKSWRKHTDISEFEDFLDDKRFEERIGHSIGDADNDDLFIIEKTGDDTVYQEKLEKFQSKISQNSINESKLRKISSGHRLYKKLESTSQVPAIKITKQNSDKRKTIYNDDEKLKKYWNDKKDLIEKAELEKQAKQKAKQDPKTRFENNYDLWDNGNKDNENQVPTTKITKKVPVHLRQKPSLLPAVEVPLPGQSYNPSEEDYNELIHSEAEKEFKKIIEEKNLENKVDKYYLTKDEAKNNEKSWLVEMSQGLFDNEPNENEPESLDETFTISKPTKKKTKAQKRRELKQKLAMKKKQQEKSVRIKENDVFRIKTIERQIKQREQQLKKLELARQAKHIESLYKPKRLSRHRFQDTEKELNLPDEISGSLRSLKTEGNLLQDRFKSLQKRNIIEPRVVYLPKRKYKLRQEIKRRHRDDQTTKTK